MDNKIHNVFFQRLAKKRKTAMNKIDFINIRAQQSFSENSINPIEIKIENDSVKDIIEKCNKKTLKFTLEGLLFSSSVQNDTEKTLITTTGLLDTKYSLTNGKIYQTIGVINLN